MRYADFLIAALLVYCAYLQWNDPDPLYWIAVYAGTGAIALAAGMGHHSTFLNTLLAGAVLAGLMVSLPGAVQYVASGDYGSIFDDMRPDNYVEPAREFFGLILLLAVLASHAYRIGRKN